MALLEKRGKRTVPRGRSIPLAQLFERPGPNNANYLIGRIGHARLVIIPTAMRNGNERVWEAHIVERPSDAPPMQAQVNGNGSIRGEDN